MVSGDCTQLLKLTMDVVAQIIAPYVTMLDRTPTDYKFSHVPFNNFCTIPVTVLLYLKQPSRRQVKRLNTCVQLLIIKQYTGPLGQPTCGYALRFNITTVLDTTLATCYNIWSLYIRYPFIECHSKLLFTTCGTRLCRISQRLCKLT